MRSGDLVSADADALGGEIRSAQNIDDGQRLALLKAGREQDCDGFHIWFLLLIVCCVYDTTAGEETEEILKFEICGRGRGP